MKLSAPTQGTFIVALVLGVVSLLTVYVPDFPDFMDNQAYYTALLAWAVLMAGNLLKGL